MSAFSSYSMEEHCTWWLQYSPALAQAPMANAALKSATISVVGEDPGAWAVPEGVSIAQATMQTAGPAKCYSLRNTIEY